MDHQAIFLLTIFALVIYYIIAEFVWQLMNKQFRRRVLISALIAALLFTQIDFINLFTQTDAETVSAAEENSVMVADMETDTEVSDDMTEPSSEAELSDDIEEQTELGGGTTQGELTEEPTENSSDDESSVENEIGEENGTVSEDEAPADGESATEDESTADEESASEGESTADEESASESETTTDEESASEDEITSEEEAELENNVPTEDENGANKKLLIDEENTAEENNKAHSFADHTAHEHLTTLFTAGGVMLMASFNIGEHNRIIWEPWGETNRMPDEAGYFYLTDDVELSDTWEVPSGITLCYNGCTIYGTFEVNGSMKSMNCLGNAPHTKTYTITYEPGDDGDGEKLEEEPVSKGEDSTIRRALYTREGYKQTGWATKENGNVIEYAFDASYTGYEDLTLYPVWEIMTYTITYKPGNGGTGKVESQTKKHGETIELSGDTFEREGYKQTGWAESDGGDKVYELGDTYTKNEGATLYPVWEKTTYTITYEPGNQEGATGTPFDESADKETPLTISSKTFKREGYKQTGWTKTDGGTVIDYDFGDTYDEDEDITLYPVWTKIYTITYEPGEGVEGTPIKESEVVGNSLEISSYDKFSREGYKQIGWQEKNGERKYKAGDEYGEEEEYADITLIPVWEKTTYTIAYDPGKYGTGDTIDSQTKEYDTPLKLTEKTYTREGYDQIGWAESEGGELLYKPGGTYTANKGATLYPVWKAHTYTITYNRGANGTGDAIGSQTKEHDKPLELTKKTYSREGYIQTGWQEEGGSKVYKPGDEYTENRNITLYPVWTKAEFMITYEPGDYSEQTETHTQTKELGKKVKLFGAKYTRDKHIQTGWQEKGAESGEVYKTEGEYTEDRDITLIPVWTAVYTVTYNKNGGTITNEGNYTSYMYGKGLTLPKPTRQGYTFNGWYEDSDFQGSPVTGISTTAKGDKTFYAKWSENSTGGGNSNVDDTAPPNDDDSGSNGGDDSDSNDNVSDTTPTPSDTDDKAETTPEPAAPKKKTSSTGSTGSTGDTSAGTNKNADNDEVSDESKESEIITDDTDIISMGNGTVTISVISDEWKYGADVANTVTVVDSILTPEQEQHAKDGENIDIRIVVKDISGNLPKEDIDVIEDGLKAESESEEDDVQLFPVEYIDISVYIKTGEDDWETITQTPEPIEIVLGISEELSDAGTLYIARSHNGKYALLDDLDSKTDTITIKTALFSTYAIVQPKIMFIADTTTNTDVGTEVSTDVNENINAAANADADAVPTTGTLAYSWMPVALCIIGILEIIGLILIFIFGKRLREDKKYARI